MPCIISSVVQAGRYLICDIVQEIEHNVYADDTYARIEDYYAPHGVHKMYSVHHAENEGLGGNYGDEHCQRECRLHYLFAHKVKAVEHIGNHAGKQYLYPQREDEYSAPVLKAMKISGMRGTSTNMLARTRNT